MLLMLFIATKASIKSILPEQVEVELCYNNSEGFHAEALLNGMTITMNTFDMTQALRKWIKEILHKDPYASGIKFILNDEKG